MAKKYQKVGQEYVKELKSQLEQTFQTRNTRIEEMRRARYAEDPVYIPEEYAAKNRVEPFHYRVVWDYCRRASSLMGGDFPRPTVRPLSQDRQANSTKRERWLPEAYLNMFTNESYVQGLDSMVETTEAWWKVWERRHDWSAGERQEDESADAYEERVDAHHKQRFPFLAEHVDTATAYHTRDNDGLAEVLEVTKRESLPMSRQFNLVYKSGDGWRKARPGEKGDSAQNSLEWWEYWNRNEYIYFADGDIASRGEHSYGRPPYFRARAIVTNSKNPAHQGMGFAYPLITLQKSISSIITMWMNWGMLNAYPLEVQRALSEDAMPIKGPVAPIEINKRGRTIVPPGWTLEYEIPPGLGGELEKLHAVLKAYTDEMTLARILQGDLSASNVSGVAAQLMLAVAKSIFGPGLKAVCAAFDDIAAFIQQRIEVSIKEPVPVWVEGAEAKGKKKKQAGEWLTLGPSDINGYYKVTHSLDPIIPAEQMSKVLMYNDGVGRGLLPERVAIEDGYLFPNPEEISAEAYVDGLRKSPQVQMMVIGTAQEALRAKRGLPPAGGAGVEMGSQANPNQGFGGQGVPQLAGVQQPLVPGAPMGPAPIAPSNAPVGV